MIKIYFIAHNIHLVIVDGNGLEITDVGFEGVPGLTHGTLHLHIFLPFVAMLVAVSHVTVSTSSTLATFTIEWKRFLRSRSF